jgi:HK97 family phage prohead protease
MSESLIFDSPVSARFEVDEEKRTIRGLAVPFGKTALSRGQRFQFAKGTLTYGDVSRVKVLVGHNFDKAVGVVTALEETDEGLFMNARIAKGASGDEVLSMAAEGVWDGLSIGLGQGGKFRTKDGVQHAVEAPLMEVSVTPMPSFEDARIHSVAASAASNRKEPEMGDEQHTETPEAPDFSAITDAINQGFANLQFPQRETVSAGGSVEVNEPSPYRFDGTEGAQSFSEDLRSYNSDPEARQRLDTFMEEAFAVTTANTSTLNPTQNRPDLFVPNLTYTRPLWDLVTTGSVDNKTPFTIPKFSSAAGLVGAHTEGVEPTPGSFTATSQTVSPTPVSGKVEIVREVWDQGGSPQADQIIWGEMLNGYFEALESKIATTLAAVATAEINLASAVDEALVDATQNILVDLQYVRGGNRFTALALDGLYFKALVNASDTSGRKLLPVTGPSNAQGTVNGGFSAVQIGNLTGRAAWALGATNASKSYLFVPSSVYAWASAPKKFVFEYRVSAVDLAIWGYSASAVTRDSDVKPIDYTTADV